MTLLPPGVKVHLALGYTDMRKGIDGLAMLVQGVLRQDPFSGHLFVFRGRRASSSGCTHRYALHCISRRLLCLCG
jgi:transposase